MNKKILIAEDEESLRKPLQIKLCKEGYDVIEAVNEREALEKATAHHPDLILLDIFMPEMSGLEMLKQLRKDQWGKQARVIMLTNLGGMEEIADATEHGVKEYIIKSQISLQDMVKKVSEALSKA